MSSFVTGDQLTKVVYNILFDAKERLLLMSPYIKLDSYFRKILDKHVANPSLEILVVFGKNSGQITRSISQEDLAYFTKFPNVTLVHAPALHAKYYGNEKEGVVTSINLYDYSFQNNIEFGVYSETSPLVEKMIESLTSKNKNIDDQAFAQAVHVAATHDVIFARRPCFKQSKGILAKLTNSKDYLEPVVLFNAIEDIVHNRRYESRRLREFPKEVDALQMSPQTLPQRAEVSSYQASSHSGYQQARQQAVTSQNVKVDPGYGFCIRTGEPIPFNPARPLSRAAYKTWASFGDEEYPEKFCHKTGRSSHGRTSMLNPIL